MLGRFSKRILLTGAGWSRNWGAPLAQEVWNALFGHAAVRANEGLRQLLLEETRFEVALARTSAAPFSPDDRRALEIAITDAFINMDHEIARVQNDGVNIYRVQDFVFRFWGTTAEKNEAGYIFTLNQDLFPERRLYNHYVTGAPAPALPGVVAKPNTPLFTTNMPAYSVDLEAHPVADPAGMRLTGQMNIIKLHGSFNWRAAEGGNVMVVGDGKAAQIQAHPLLAWYRDIFRAALSAGDVRLMIMGYGFADEHINSAIASAIADHGLQVFIWDTVADLQARVTAAPHGPAIWRGLMGAAGRRLIEVFPSDQSETEELRRIRREFFG